MPKANIFVNYRRAQNAAIAGRLYDRFLKHFSSEEIFIDVDAIAPGMDFVSSLDNRVSRCNAFVAIIGPDWASAKDADGNSRLHDPNDYVRIEIEAALSRNIPVIPVLVDGAEMPETEELPDSLQSLSRRQAVQISHHRFSAEVDDLANSISSTLGISTRRKDWNESKIPDTVDTNPRNISEILFSFQGRLSRKKYWKGAMIYLLCQIVLSLIGGAYLFGNIISSAPDAEAAQRALESFDTSTILTNWNYRSILLMTAIPMYWPFFALSVKRFHDMNIGKIVWVPYIMLNVIFLLCLALGFVDLNIYNMGMVFSFTVLFVLGLVEGTRGPNRFGLDPLRDVRHAANEAQ